MNHSYHLFLIAAVLLFLLWWMRPVEAAVYNATKMSQGLNEAMTLWDDQNITHYQITTQRECSCLAKFAQPIKIEVDHSEIVKVRDISNTPITDQEVLEESVFSIEDLFGEIQDAVHRNAMSIRVNYNSEYGYPTSIHVYDSHNVDDIFILEVKEFIPLSERQLELDRAIDLWNAHDMSHYGYGFQRQCEECPLQYTKPMRIIVENNQVKEANYRDPHIPVPQDVMNDGGTPTITEIFDLLQDAIDTRAEEMIVSYHNELGFPVFVFVDYDETIAGDEIVFLCGALISYSELERERIEHQELWEAQEIVSYTFSYQRYCTGMLCDTDLGTKLVEEHSIQVVNEKVFAVDGEPVDRLESPSTQFQRSSNGTEVIFTAAMFPTIPDLFVKVKDAIDYGAYKVDAAYNETFGYPTRIFIDQHADTNLDSSLSATANLLSVEKGNAASVTGKKKLDLASAELFPTVVAFILLTTIFV
jgi:Family of unknown function (DUF6174)